MKKYKLIPIGWQGHGRPDLDFTSKAAARKERTARNMDESQKYSCLANYRNDPCAIQWSIFDAATGEEVSA